MQLFGSGDVEPSKELPWYHRSHYNDTPMCSNRTCKPLVNAAPRRSLQASSGVQA